jgi:hypothetical protein
VADHLGRLERVLENQHETVMKDSLNQHQIVPGKV